MHPEPQIECTQMTLSPGTAAQPEPQYQQPSPACWGCFEERCLDHIQVSRIVLHNTDIIVFKLISISKDRNRGSSCLVTLKKRQACNRRRSSRTYCETCNSTKVGGTCRVKRFQLRLGIRHTIQQSFHSRAVKFTSFEYVYCSQCLPARIPCQLHSGHSYEMKEQSRH